MDGRYLFNFGPMLDPSRQSAGKLVEAIAVAKESEALALAALAPDGETGLRGISTEQPLGSSPLGDC